MSVTPAVLQRGQTLIEMDDRHDFLYVVESGWLARSRTINDGRRQIIVIFLPGEFCGIKTIFMSRQPDDIEALTTASTRRIHYKDACDLAGKDFAVAMLLAWQLAQDERRLHNWTVRLGRANAEERLAALLLELRTRLKRLGLNGVDSRYGLPLTLQQIADHVGLTPVHVGRILRRFREQASVVIANGEVTFLHKSAALEDLAKPVMDIVGE
jgi:CRP-like cAMP-binding protein